MTHQYDRAAIMRRAHQLKRERAMSLGDAMRLAWGEAKSPKAIAIQPTLVLPPVVSAARDIAKAVRSIKRIKLAVRIQLGAEVETLDGASIRWAGQKQIAGGYDRGASL